MPDDTTADWIVRNFDNPGRAAQVAVQKILAHVAAELRRTATTGTEYTGGTTTEEAIAIMRKVAAEHGYPVYT